MYKQLLTRRFFRDNPYKELSAQRITYTMLCADGFEKLVEDAVKEHLDNARKQKILEEKRIIEAENNPEVLLQLFRKDIDVMNRPYLINKALKYENEILPKLIEKLIRNNHDTYIENAVRLLVKSKGDYTNVLMKRYSEIRSPYVQSLVCLVLGLRGREEVIPWIINKYFEMKKHYPDENYDQGPLLALYELHSRLYSND
jgi:hypothetical protein